MAKVKPKAVLYLCDRKRCGDQCHYPDCRHTTDISHAVHGGAFPSGLRYVQGVPQNFEWSHGPQWRGW